MVHPLCAQRDYKLAWSFDFLYQTEDSPTASGDATQDSEQSAEALKESIRLTEVCLVDIDRVMLWLCWSCCDCDECSNFNKCCDCDDSC